jgi:hypothetical protein
LTHSLHTLDSDTGKRDLISGKRDLISSKRDLILSKRDLSKWLLRQVVFCTVCRHCMGTPVEEYAGMAFWGARLLQAGLFWHYSRSLLRRKASPGTPSLVTSSVGRSQKRPTIVSKETYYSVKRDLQKRPAHPRWWHHPPQGNVMGWIPVFTANATEGEVCGHWSP